VIVASSTGVRPSASPAPLEAIVSFIVCSCLTFSGCIGSIETSYRPLLDVRGPNPNSDAGGGSTWPCIIIIRWLQPASIESTPRTRAATRHPRRERWCGNRSVAFIGLLLSRVGCFVVRDWNLPPHHAARLNDSAALFER